MARDYVLQPFSSGNELRIQYESELNAQQLAAVQAAPGPNLVLAGAGAGKTRTLTYRVAWLLEHNVPAERILLLTFTNKAAREMMSRVGDLIGGNLTQLWGGTFHSIGSRILRRHADLLGYRQDFTIADREDSGELVKAAIGDLKLDETATRFPNADALADLFSSAINTGRSIAKVVAEDFSGFVSLTAEIERAYTLYGERKRKAAMMDFDDLLFLWLRLMREDAAVREVLQRRFQHLLVDEYQDTNTLQGELIDVLAGGHQNIMAVGDDAQSIYAWRGANFANILDFPKRYPGARVFKIETNYRSTPEILSLANAAIALNTRQFAKELKAARRNGELPASVVCGDAAEQAGFVAQRVLELREEGKSLSQMCVLYRSHFHALELQLELTRRNIPFLITSGIRFFEQAHIKDAVAYLKFVTQPRDELAYKRLVRMLPGVGVKGAEKLWQAFLTALDTRAAEPSLEAQTLPQAPPPSDESGAADAPPLPPAEPPCAPLLMEAVVQKAVPKKSAAAWAQFAATISQLEATDIRNAPDRMLQLILDAGYADYLEAAYERHRTRLEDIHQLRYYAQRFTSTPEFLSELALQTNIEAEAQSRSDGDDEDRLRLSTIHQAKGLEFEAVFLIMLCEGLFPSEHSKESLEREEEERRLFYVAVTRAKDHLYPCHPLLRMISGNSGVQRTRPSRFLQELPTQLYEEWNLRPYFSTPSPRSTPSPSSTPIDDGPHIGDEPF